MAAPVVSDELGSLKLTEGVVAGCAWIGPLGGKVGRGVEALVWELMIWKVVD